MLVAGGPAATVPQGSGSQSHALPLRGELPFVHVETAVNRTVDAAISDSVDWAQLNVRSLSNK